jgi:hypothetical protein
VVREGEKSLRTLTDVTDALFDDAVSEAMKKFALDNKPYVMASAIVGVTGFRKVLFSATLIFSKRKNQTFDNLESAMDWLASQK